jgi:hypothetical protein
METLLSNRRLALETLLQIENKARQVVPFSMNIIQADMFDASKWRDIYVKPAQVGATTIHVADFFLDNLFVNGTVSVIISYDETNAKRLILKAKRFHNYLQHRIPSIPKMEHKGSNELTWEVKDAKQPFYSVMYIFSARSYTLGRGEPIHNLLLDEYAFWPMGTHEDVFSSAVQRVPLMPGTKIRIQSTANGEDNPFCEMYRAAKEGTSVSKSVYKPHFYPWFIHPEYTMRDDDEFCMDGDDQSPLPNIQPDEDLLINRLDTTYGLSAQDIEDKIRWRRYKRAEMASLRRSGETVMMFEQEYPEDDESCFLTAGGQAYNIDIISEKLRGCYPAPIQQAVVNPKTGISATLDIWYPPEEGKGYLLSIDPGKGKVSESVGQVWTFKEGYEDKGGKVIPPDMVHCATISGWYDEWEMAEYCKEAARFYKNTVIAPEDNLDIVSHLRDWPSLYYREDPRDGKVVRAVGWQTNVSTKPYMITELSRNLEYITSHDIRFWSQCKNIRRDSSVRSGISVVGADDHHDCGGIAIVCRGAMPVDRGYVGSCGWSESWGRL